MALLRLLLVAAAAVHAAAFVPLTSPKSSLVRRQALWRHFVPREEHIAGDDSQDSTTVSITGATDNFKNGVLASFLALVLALPSASLAVSGGGLDYANLVRYTYGNCVVFGSLRCFDFDLHSNFVIPHAGHYRTRLFWF